MASFGDHGIGIYVRVEFPVMLAEWAWDVWTCGVLSSVLFSSRYPRQAWV